MYEDLLLEPQCAIVLKHFFIIIPQEAIVAVYS
jgi:hypothetical protein